jgi:hypothetical protein
MATKPGEEDYKGWFKNGQASTDDTDFKRSEYLWNEYQYRHDLIWSLVFRLTGAVILLSIIPYIQHELIARLGPWKLWILAPPFLAVALALLGFRRISQEMRLLDHIRNLYRPLQDRLVGLEFHKKSGKPFGRVWFNIEVKVYLITLLTLALINFLLVAYLLWANRLVQSNPVAQSGM